MTSKQSELTVIVKAKELCSYVIIVTEKSPKRFRFTLVAKLQGYALNAVEKLYRANDVYLNNSDDEAIKERRNFQQGAMTEFNLLGYLAQLSKEEICITDKQYEQITKKVFECKNLLGAWIRSDNKRFGYKP